MKKECLEKFTTVENPVNEFLDQNKVVEILYNLRKIIFLGYFDKVEGNKEEYVSRILKKVEKELCDSIRIACLLQGKDDNSKEITKKFIDSVDCIKYLLSTDIDALYNGDPASKDKNEIIMCYPGLFAIMVYRISHILYDLDVMYIPRILSEYAHSKTGIDIHPGAKIGTHFCIDHGTGVVIGETTVIGNNVKIYQGVTLGAKSIPNAEMLRNVRRHPTIKDNVIIYSGASILGGETVIGENCVIGSNVFITNSVEANTTVKPTKTVINK